MDSQTNNIPEMDDVPDFDPVPPKVLRRSGTIQKLVIRGFKSIRNTEIELRNLNIIIGANGAGKSNLIQVFRMLRAMSQNGFADYVMFNGGTNDILFNGPKTTPEIFMQFEFMSRSIYSNGANSYRFTLTPTMNEKFIIKDWCKYMDSNWYSYGKSNEESYLKDRYSVKNATKDIGYFIYDAISNWMIYHFHDTSPMSPMRKYEIIEDYHSGLRSDASNIAPFLLFLKNEKFKKYSEILNAIRLVMPFFEDFRLDIQKFGEAEKVRLSWQQKGSDYPMQPYHLSDGSIRFICLATALLQPNPPSAIIIDEPELGLHPDAIAILAELIQDAATRTQVIIATQSPALIDQFAIDDIIVANRKDGASTFERLDRKDFSVWLENYTIGELWAKNVIMGGPVYE